MPDGGHYDARSACHDRGPSASRAGDGEQLDPRQLHSREASDRADRDRDGDGDTLAVAAKAAGRVAGSGRRFRPVLRQVAGTALAQARISDRAVPRHHARLAAPEFGLALQPMEADASPASGVRGRPVLADHRLLHGGAVFPDAARRARKRPDSRPGRGQEQRALDAGDDLSPTRFSSPTTGCGRPS